MFKRLTTAAFIFGLLAAAPPALARDGAAPAMSERAAPTQVQAQRPGGACGPREAIVANLEKKHAERRQARGLAGTSALLEIWASPDRGSWTVLITRPDGVACVLAVGDHWLDERALVTVGDPA